MGSYIKLGKESFDIHNQWAFLKRKATVPYDQIAKVLYVRPARGLMTDGFLIIRSKANLDRPVPTGQSRRDDGMAVVFNYMQDPVFYHVFCVLKTMAPATACFSMELPQRDVPGIEAWTDSADMDAHFDTHSPYREQAMAVLCGKTGVNLPSATEIINRAFDRRQEELYRKEPLKAVRDLNRVIIASSLGSYKT